MSAVCYGKILVVEDDSAIRETLRVWLNRSGFSTLFAVKGSDGLQAFRREKPDLVILDVMLPEIDGLEFCKRIREFSTAPVLMLSALGEATDRILGLEVGADDYLCKPFNPNEIVARVRALLRRSKFSRADEMSAEKRAVVYADLRLEPDGHLAHWKGSPLQLTPLEFDILHLLVSNPGSTITREKFLNKVWGEDSLGDHRTVDSHIRNLRKKVRKAGCPPSMIESVWGVGYRVPRLEN